MPSPIMIEHPETGERMSLNALARSAGINPVTLVRRYHRGIRGAALIDKQMLTGPRPKSAARAGTHTKGLCRTSKALIVRDMADIGRVWMRDKASIKVREHAHHH